MDTIGIVSLAKWRLDPCVGGRKNQAFQLLSEQQSAHADQQNNFQVYICFFHGYIYSYLNIYIYIFPCMHSAWMLCFFSIETYTWMRAYVFFKIGRVQEKKQFLFWQIVGHKIIKICETSMWFVSVVLHSCVSHDVFFDTVFAHVL